jgi:hypothetical protein
MEKHKTMILPFMTPVASSNISAVGYTNGDLYVAFKNDTVYRYFGVSATIYTSLMSAPSHGRFLNTYVRDLYRYQRLR